MEGVTLRKLDDRIWSVINHFVQKNATVHGHFYHVDLNSYQMVFNLIITESTRVTHCLRNVCT